MYSSNRIYCRRSKESVLALAGEISAGFPNRDMFEPNFEGLVGNPTRWERKNCHHTTMLPAPAELTYYNIIKLLI